MTGGPTAVRRRGGAPSTRSDWSLERLVEAAQQGDEPSFVELVTRQRALVESVCARVLLGRDRAERAAAVNRCLVAAWRGLPRFAGRSKFSTWLYTVCWREALAVEREARRRPEPAGEVPERSSVGDGLSGWDERQWVRQGLGLLSPEDREVLWVFYALDASAEEVAQTMGEVLGCELSPGAVRLRAFRAKQRLREALRQLDHDGRSTP